MESANCIPGLAYMRWFVVKESLQYQVIQSRWIPFSGWQHNTFFACQLRHQLGCGMSHWWCVAIIKWKWQQEVEQFLFNRQEPDFEVDRATATDQPLDMWHYAASVDSSVSSPILQTNAASPKKGKMSTDTVHWTVEDTNHWCLEFRKSWRLSIITLTSPKGIVKERKQKKTDTRRGHGLLLMIDYALNRQRKVLSVSTKAQINLVGCSLFVLWLILSFFSWRKNEERVPHLMDDTLFLWSRLSLLVEHKLSEYLQCFLGLASPQGQTAVSVAFQQMMERVCPFFLFTIEAY